MPIQYLVLISILGWGISNVFYKASLSTMSPFVVSAIIASVSILMAPLPFLLVKVDTHISGLGVLFAVCGALCVCAGSIAFFYAMKTNGAGQITAITSIYPALTFLLSMLLFK